MAKRHEKRRKAGQVTPVADAWRRSRPGLAAVVFFGAFVNVLKFAMPLYLLQVLDRVPSSRSVETLILLTAIVVVAITFGFALDVIRRRMLTRWSVWIERQFGPLLVSKGLSQGVTSGKFDVDRGLSDLGKLRRFVSKSLVGWLDLLWAPAFIFVTFLIHPYLGLFALVTVALLLFLGLLQNWLLEDPASASGRANREASEVIHEASVNRESVGALGMADTLSQSWTETASGRLAERERIDAQWHLFRSLMRALGQFLRIGLIALGIWLLIRGELTLGGVFAARVTAVFGYGMFEVALRNVRGLTDTVRAYRRIKVALEEQPPVETELHPGTEKASLRIANITHRHPGQRQDLFRRLSLDVAPGELLLINGPGGTGKTTLAKLLVGVAKPRFGKVFLGDSEIADMSPDHRNRLLGFLPQHTEIFGGSIRQNIARMEEGSLVEVVKAAKLAGFHETIIDLPDGYDTELIAETFDQLSGSQRKRIALARAFYKAPKLLVLDEPSANLDATSRRIIEAALRQMKANGAIVVVTQSVRSPQFERMADKYLDLKGGSFELLSAEDLKKRRSAGKGDLRRVK